MCSSSLTDHTKRFKPQVSTKPLTCCTPFQGATCLSTAANIYTQSHATNSHQNQFHFLAWRDLTEPLSVHNSSPLLTQVCLIPFIKKNEICCKVTMHGRREKWTESKQNMQTYQGLKWTCTWHASTRLQSCVTSDPSCRFP